MRVISGSVAEEGVRHRCITSIRWAKDDLNGSLDAPVLALYESVLCDEKVEAEVINQSGFHYLLLKLIILLLKVDIFDVLGLYFIVEILGENHFSLCVAVQR